MLLYFHFSNPSCFVRVGMLLKLMFFRSFLWSKHVKERNTFRVNEVSARFNLQFLTDLRFVCPVINRIEEESINTLLFVFPYFRGFSHLSLPVLVVFHVCLYAYLNVVLTREDICKSAKYCVWCSPYLGGGGGGARANRFDDLGTFFRIG